MYSHLIIFLGKMFKAEVKQEEKDKMNIKPKLIDKKVFLQFLKIPYLKLSCSLKSNNVPKYCKIIS